MLDTSLVRWEVISEFWREAVLGVLILLSVTADTLLSRKLLAISLKKTNLLGNKSDLPGFADHEERAMTPANGNSSNPASRLKRLMSWEGFLLAVLWIVFAVNASMSPAFFTVGNQINLFNLSIEKIIVALIMTFIIINGEIDLSVASVMGLSACTFGWLYHAGMSAGLAIVVVMGVGFVCGAFNGFLSPGLAFHRWLLHCPL